ncbi:hypothetical protein CC86DRAFT_432467 [Ophiobolus disseminans]|uniref:Uncharacterized protein n=1 Tax=Ophiobolus disseminans TaxID=1469910 RepID=A0A6A6ZEB3_9PLEO|nr:hypothetical protein CC86DRAFT_432467 [Ophiobolus disseminans]
MVTRNFTFVCLISYAYAVLFNISSSVPSIVSILPTYHNRSESRTETREVRSSRGLQLYLTVLSPTIIAVITSDKNDIFRTALDSTAYPNASRTYRNSTLIKSAALHGDTTISATPVRAVEDPGPKHATITTSMPTLIKVVRTTSYASCLMLHDSTRHSDCVIRNSTKPAVSRASNTGNAIFEPSSTGWPAWSNSRSLITSCPTSPYASRMPKISQPTGCASEDAYLNDMFFYNYEDRCVAQSCSLSWWSALDAYSGPVPTMTTKVPYMNITWGSDGHAITENAILTTLTMSYNGTALDVVRREAPCCGACKLWANELQLLYWPDQATRDTTSKDKAGNRNVDAIAIPTPSKLRTYVDENGFTFISPSVYMAMTSLRAWDSCGPVGQCQDVLSTTLAFNAEEISTLKPSRYVTSCSGRLPGSRAESSYMTRRMTFADLHRNCSSYVGYFYLSDFPGQFIMEEDACHPYISIPSRVRALHTDWASCLPRYGAGLFDPPRTLGLGQQLVPTTIPSSTKNIASASPTPGIALPKIPAATSSQATNPMMTMVYSTASLLQPVPSSTPPLLLPIEITLRSASSPNEKNVVVQLWPTWIPAAVGYSSNVFEKFSSDSRHLAQSSETKTEHGIKEGSSARDSTSSLFTPYRGEGTLALIVGTQTLLLGHGITISGTTTSIESLHTTVMGGAYLFFDPPGMQVIIDGHSTVQLSSAMAALQAQASPFVLELEGQTYTADSMGRFSVGTQILIPGGTITIGQSIRTLSNGQIASSRGTLVYLDPHGRTVLVNGQALSALERAPPPEPSKLTVVLGQTYSVPLAGAATIVVGGVTFNIRGGGVTVVGGSTIVLLDAHTSTTREAITSSPTINGHLEHSSFSLRSARKTAQVDVVSTSISENFVTLTHPKRRQIKRQLRQAPSEHPATPIRKLNSSEGLHITLQSSTQAKTCLNVASTPATTTSLSPTHHHGWIPIHQSQHLRHQHRNVQFRSSSGGGLESLRRHSTTCSPRWTSVPISSTYTPKAKTAGACDRTCILLSPNQYDWQSTIEHAYVQAATGSLAAFAQLRVNVSRMKNRKPDPCSLAGVEREVEDLRRGTLNLSEKHQEWKWAEDKYRVPWHKVEHAKADWTFVEAWGKGCGIERELTLDETE